MDIVNVNRPEWDAIAPESPFRRRAFPLGARLGAERLGATVYELDPGVAISPYHQHYANEEWLLVLAGTPQLRTPDGIRTLEVGDIAAFVRGPDGAHRIFNASSAPARVLMLSTTESPEIAVYPDDGMWLAVAGTDGRKAFADGAESDRPAAMRAAMEASARGDREAPGET